MSELQEMRDRVAIVDTVNRLFVAVDDRDWSVVRECLADRVHFDVTSLGAPAATEMSAEEVITGWQQGLAKIDAVHHLSGNFRVEQSGDEAYCFCYATAHHYRRVESGRNLRIFAGSYDYRLRREGGAWKITQFKFNAKFVDGNLELENEPRAEGSR